MNDRTHPTTGVDQGDDSRAHNKVSRPPLRPDMTVRQIAMDYPQCQEVLRRYGEPENRPTKFGHLEPLDHFAKRRNIDLESLLAELAQAAGVSVVWDSAQAQHVHRPFIAWALAITLSLGAGWGAILLFEIGWDSDFDAIPSNHVVAHGAAQLWGFIALFVVGIALRYLPMTTSEPRPARPFCRFLLGAFLIGVIGGFIWSLAPRELPWAGPLSGIALVCGAVLFLGFVFRQVRGKWGDCWAQMICAACVWMVVWAGATVTLRSWAATDGPAAFDESMRQLLMELAIFGFSLNAIYGFGRKLLPGIAGSATPRSRVVDAVFWLHNAGVALLAISHFGVIPLAGSMGAAAVTAGAICYAVGMRGFIRVRRTSPRPEVGLGVLGHYVRLAFVWLLVGLALLVAGDLYWMIQGLEPPHAYLGAVRHALTVGFMTTLILGVAQKLLPILGHTLLPWPGLVVPTLLLIGFGNLLRVVTELATPVSTIAFALMPYSAVFELAALCLFTANALRTLWPPADPLLRTGQVTAMTSVAVLLAEYPWLEDHLFAWGLHYVGRVRSVPRELTVGTLATSEGKVPEEIVDRINQLLRESPQGGAAASIRSSAPMKGDEKDFR